MEPYIALVRRAERRNGLYEDFEFITVLSRGWIKRNPVSYPAGYSRILPSFEQSESDAEAPHAARG